MMPPNSVRLSPWGGGILQHDNLARVAAFGGDACSLGAGGGSGA